MSADAPARKVFDWATAHARIAAIDRAVTAGHTASPEQAEAILRERARRLAVPPQGGAPASDHLELVGFTLGEERYVLEMKYLREVLRGARVAPVPRAPAFVIGITSVRGDMVSLFDLGLRLGHPARPPARQASVLVLGRERLELGFPVDALAEVCRLDPGELSAPPVNGHRPRYTRGIARDGLIALDGAALLDDPELILSPGNGHS